METMEDLYKGLFKQFDEDVSAANPYGCNQYGHRGGHQGGTGKASVDMEQRKKQVEDRKKRISDAKRALSNHKKNVYNPAYIRVHGMDDEPTEKDWKAFEDADNERRRLEYELEKLESESENTPGTNADKGVADGKLDEATRKKFDENWEKAVREMQENERKFKEMVEKNEPWRNEIMDRYKIMGEWGTPPKYGETLSGERAREFVKADRFYDVLDDVVKMMKTGPGKEKLRDVPEVELKRALMREYMTDNDSNVFKKEKPKTLEDMLFRRSNKPQFDKDAAQSWLNKNRENIFSHL